MSAEEHSTALGLDIPTTNRTGRMIRRPAWHYDYDFSTDENCNISFNYEEAILSAEAEKWQPAMQNEFKNFVEIKTWDLVALPSGKPLTKGKWVFDIKRKSDGLNEQYKARYVAKGFRQIYGQNCTDTFSPTISMTVIRSLLAIAAQDGLQHNITARQIDVKTVFFNSTLEDEIFIEQPRGFESGERDVCELINCNYGIRQAKNPTDDKSLTDRSFF